MARPQRDDPPSRCALRRTGTIEAIKWRAAEKKAEEEKKKAEARVCAARCRLKRCPPINRNRRGRNGRKSCARSSAANHGFVQRSAGRLRGNKWRRHREIIRLRQGYGGQVLLRKSSGLSRLRASATARQALCLNMLSCTVPRPNASAKS